LSHGSVQKVGALVAILFGLATLAAGGSVLAGRDPGYVVYRPLLVFTTLMGAVYIAAGILGWRDARAGRHAAGFVLGLNLLVLVRILYLYNTSAVVAPDSVGAMLLRTGVWLVLLLAFAWAGRAPRGAARATR
jgi:hypothetical protein